MLDEQAARIDGFRSEIAGNWDLAAIRSAVIASQRRRRYLNTINRDQNVSWDYQPIIDAKNLYIRNSASIYELEQRSRFPRVK